MKTAAVAFQSKVGHLEHNLDATKEQIRLQAEEGVGFVLFPELNLSGYTKDLTILRKLQDKKQQVLQELAQLSDELQMGFAVGFPEAMEEHFFIAHFVFYKGDLLGVHRKTHLGPTELATFTAGNAIQVFELGDLKLGIQLCYESHFPEISFAQAKQGAHLLAVAFASPRETMEEKKNRFQRFLSARAYDNACYVLACNLGQKGEMNFPSLTLGYDPKGNEIKTLTETLLIDCDINEIERIKNSRMGWFNKSKRTEILRKYYES